MLEHSPDGTPKIPRDLGKYPAFNVLSCNLEHEAFQISSALNDSYWPVFSDPHITISGEVILIHDFDRDRMRLMFTPSFVVNYAGRAVYPCNIASFDGFESYKRSKYEFIVALTGEKVDSEPIVEKFHKQSDIVSLEKTLNKYNSQTGIQLFIIDKDLYFFKNEIPISTQDAIQELISCHQDYLASLACSSLKSNQYSFIELTGEDYQKNGVVFATAIEVHDKICQIFKEEGILSKGTTERIKKLEILLSEHPDQFVETPQLFQIHSNSNIDLWKEDWIFKIQKVSRGFCVSGMRARYLPESEIEHDGQGICTGDGELNLNLRLGDVAKNVEFSRIDSTFEINPIDTCIHRVQLSALRHLGIDAEKLARILTGEFLEPSEDVECSGPGHQIIVANYKGKNYTVSFTLGRSGELMRSEWSEHSHIEPKGDGDFTKTLQGKAVNSVVYRDKNSDLIITQNFPEVLNLGIFIRPHNAIAFTSKDELQDAKEYMARIIDLLNAPPLGF